MCSVHYTCTFQVTESSIRLRTLQNFFSLEFIFVNFCQQISPTCVTGDACDAIYMKILYKRQHHHHHHRQSLHAKGSRLVVNSLCSLLTTQPPLSPEMCDYRIPLNTWNYGNSAISALVPFSPSSFTELRWRRQCQQLIITAE